MTTPPIDADVLAIYAAHGLTPGARPPREVKPGYIDLTPTYRAILPVILTALQNGTPDGKASAITEAYRIADVADLYNAIGSDPRDDVAQVSAAALALLNAVKAFTVGGDDPEHWPEVAALERLLERRQ